ncbi:MAG: hypothetical protein R3268_08765 [Acidiferrobacterales bacterium]|nr:hypothetical protein [Acidiferrobacterales bacterium]
MKHMPVVSKDQVVLEIDGTKHVMLGRLCRASGIPYNHGMDVAQRHSTPLGRTKQSVSHGSSTTQCVVLPIDRLHKWLRLLNTAAVPNLAIAAELAKYQSRASDGPRLPYPEFIISALNNAGSNAESEKVDLAVTRVAPKGFCKAVDASEPPKQSRLVSLANQIDKAESRLRIAEKAAAAGKVQLAELKREMAKELGINMEPEFATVADYCARHRINIDTDKASAIGRVASAYCKQRGVETGLAPHPFCKTVKTYPVEAIEYALSQRGGNA